MDIVLAQNFLLWLKERRDEDPEQYLLDVVPSEIERVAAKPAFVSMAQDLLDDMIIESSLKSGWGAEEAELPVRVRLTDLGRRIVRRHDGRLDRWEEDESQPAFQPGEMNLTVHGDVNTSQIGVGQYVTQTQNHSTNSTSEQALTLLERVLAESSRFDIDDEVRDELEDSARGGIRELREGDAMAPTEELPASAKRRMSKVASILGGFANRVATEAATTAGNAAAQELSEGLHQLIT